ncbi:MAG: FHA domain-containing protein [Deltaproteobacteria bacterium]|nr:FHA domain-containing protein [Deltaproteobacteria bacterium]
MPGRVILVINAPNGDVRELPLEDLPVVLGRDESCDVRVDDRKVSRRHASFRLVDGEPWVEDLGSQNGVKLNGKRIPRKSRILPDDVALVGSYEVRIRNAPEVEPAAPRGPGTRVLADADREPDTRHPRADPSVRPEGTALVGLDGPTRGQVFELEPGEHIVGRADCQIPILDDSVSRRHAKVTHTGDRISVKDLNSANGVFVNGIRVGTEDLNDADEVRFGRVAFRVNLPRELSRRVGAVVPDPSLARDETKLPRSPARRRLLVAGLAAALGLTIGGLVLVLITRGPRAESADAGDPALLAANDNSAVPDADIPFADPSDEDPELDPEAPATDASSDLDSGVGIPIEVPAAIEVPAEPDAGPVAEDASEAIDAGEADGGALVVAPRRIATSTSPYSPKGSDGLPLDLPNVDDAFDFDAFVSEQLSRAEALAENRGYREVREVLATLLERDPINAKAQTLLEKVSLAEVAAQRLAQAVELETRGRLVRALEVYREVPKGSKEFEEATQRLSSLVPRVVESELEHAKDEVASKKTWKKAHKRLVRLLQLVPDAKGAETAVRDLEGRMKEKEIIFTAYEPLPPEPPSGPVTPAEVLSARYPDRDFAASVALYIDGKIDKAIGSLSAIEARASGDRKSAARELGQELVDLRERYLRVRTEMSNDPQRAWSQLIELEAEEAKVLPTGLVSFSHRELAGDLARAFADRGAALLEQTKYEDAFRFFETAAKLNSESSVAGAGLARLEQKGLDLVKEGDLLLTKNRKEACDRYKRVTRITRASSEPHKIARSRAEESCSG